MQHPGSDMSKLAENLVRNCLRIRSTDNVTVFFYPHNMALAEDIATECFRVGADALLNLYTDSYYTAYLKYLPVESLRQPSVYCRGLTELSTAQFWVGGAYDPSIFRKASAEKLAAADEGETAAHFDLARERKVRGLSVDLGLATAPRAKAYGFLVGSVPSPWAGRSIRRLRWEFRDGRLTAFDGDANAKALAAVYANATGDKDRVAGLSIGLNPKAALGFLQNAIVGGAVTIGVGANEDLGGVNKSSFFFPVTVPNATLEIDGLSLVQNGRIAV